MTQNLINPRLFCALCLVALSLSLSISKLSAQSTLSSFTLINADNDTDIGTLSDGDTIKLFDLPTNDLNIRANTSPSTVSKVIFDLDGDNNYRTEGVAPYALEGDKNGDYNPWTPSPGLHTLTATPYHGTNGGLAGTPLTITFLVVDQLSVDCNNDLNGSAFIDDCGVCAGGNTGVVANSAKDACGICFGDGSTCAGGCTEPTVVSMSLINADDNSTIRTLDDGDTIDQRQLLNFSIRANICNFPTGSVRFLVDGNNFNTDNGDPYALNGNSNGFYNSWNADSGIHVITAIPFSNSNAGGTAGQSLTLNLLIIDTGYIDTTAFGTLPNLVCGQAFGGRIALSFDGNLHDSDDYVSLPMAMAMIYSAGLRDSLVHVEYNNHLGFTDSLQEYEMRLSAREAVHRWGYSDDIMYDAIRYTDSTSDALAAAINASSAASPLWILAGGPMATIGRGLEKADSNKRQFVRVVSHSIWNENHRHFGAPLNYDWDELITSFGDDSTQFIEVPDMNGTPGFSRFKGPRSRWRWLINDPDTNFHWLYGRNRTTAFDASDAGMAYWLISGGDTTAGVNEARGLLETPCVVTCNCSCDANSAPSSVLITAPADSASFIEGDSLVVRTSVTDLEGNISHVQFLRDGQLMAVDSTMPFEYLIDSLVAGNYNLTSRATDSCGKEQNSATVSISVTGADCNGDAGGSAFVDNCAICAGGNTGITPNTLCTDCNAVVGGSAVVDSCGVCAGGTTGIIPNATCVDCNGDPNGTAGIDGCGICAGGNTGLIPNASCLDCNGDVNGNAAVDACGICAGGNTGVIPNSSCTDCNLVVGGSAFVDSCGVCAGGTTGVVPNATCVDCNGDPNGTAGIDGCGVCAGGNTGLVPNSTCLDCNGDVNGTAAVDACGICAGGNTGVIPNTSCTDCNAVAGGSAFIDSCGVCAGGTTSIVPNSTCASCVPNEVVSLTLMQAGSGGQPIRKIFNGDILYKDQLGNFSIRADICNDGTVGSVVFNLNGSDIRTENIAPYSINGDNSNNGFRTWNVAAGSYTLIATPSTNSNGNGTLGVVETVTFSVVDIKPSQDCNGDAGGSALVDACGVCAGGNTGNIPNASCSDCSGTPNGSAAIDACGVCAGGTTGLTPDATCTDCNGDVNGSATVDACGVCAGGNTGVIANTSCTDCNGVVNGTAVTNACGICVLGNTGNAFDFNCNVDCNGDLNGTAALDACGVCAGGNTGVVADASCTDCFGVVNGSASIDACGICTGGTTGLIANASCADCNGVPNGTAALDTCGVCSGGNTGIAVNSTCGGTACVPVEVVTLMLIDATTNQDLRPLVNGDVINLTALPNFSVRADVCSDPDVESVEFDLNGTEIATQNVPPYSVTGDNNGVFTPWALAVGTYTLEAIPFPKNWGNGPAGVSKQVTFQVLNGPPPPDCDGVAGGSAAIDACGVCAGGTTGIVPGSSCSDCNGTPNGTAAVDACGICAGGTTGVTPDVSCTDCNGDVNGTALVDACGICAGGNTGVIANASCTDCNGDINGTAVTNGCGICVLGNTGNAFDFNCNVDCNGDLNGTAALDACGVCAGGNTGVVADASCTDCFGVVNGSASIDACGICTGGTTGLVANASCADCNGVPNGTAAIDTCGVCSGGNTGIAVNSTCGGTACVPVEVVTLMLIDATTNQDLRPLVNGDVINLTALPNFSVRADVCSDPDVESVEFDLNGTEIATQNVPPYSVTGDNNGVFTPWALAVGTYTLEAIPFPKNWGNGPAGVSKQVTFQVLNGPPPPDCDGVAGGSAAIDACGVCAGGTTGIVPGSSCSDCNGTPNGTAAVDACGICAGGTTGVTPDVSCTDCNGDVNGTALVDACGICAGGNTGVIADASCTDCNGVVNGTAITNACGICVLGNTGNPANFNCNIDCNGDLNGTAAIDACGVCAGGNTGVVADASCTDCFGVVNGSASIDACGICTGGTTGLVANASCADCNGVPNGTAAIDTCGVCSGGNTGIAVNSTCGGGSCVPNEVVTLMLIDASNGQDIGPMANGDTIDLSVLTDFSVRAEVCSDPDVESVVFSLNSNDIRTESVPPYSVNGDNNGNYSPWGLAAGSYTLVGTPYSGNGGGGNAGVAKSVSFHVVDGPPPPPVIDCNGVLGGSAYIDACGNCVGGNTGQSPCTPPAGCDEFIEVNGLVVVEVESEPKANGSWYEGTGSINGLNPVGASGSYYMWRANCVSGSDPNWVYSGCGGTNGGSDANAMTYEVFISNPGRYRFRMRSWQPRLKLSSHGAGTENNDFWLQLPDGGGIKKKGGNEITIGTSEWVKIYQNSPANWVWGSKTVDNNPHDIYIDFSTAGTYRIKIGARSKLMALDRFVLYRSDNPSNNVTDANATTAMPPESQRGPCVSSADDNTGNTVNGQPGVQSEQTQGASNSLGQDDAPLTELNITAYPNPTTGMLQLGIIPADAEAFIELYDATGKLLLARPQEGEEQRLDLTSYPNGIYMLKIRTADQLKVTRVYKE